LSRVAAALLLAAASAAGVRPERTASRITPVPPRLIVAIAVDQFSTDLFSEYRGIFTAGLKRLASGAVFPAGYQSHAATETCPGHATILTGARPGRAGIIANNWFDQSLTRADKKVYCAEDPTVPGSSSDRYTVSAYHLRVPDARRSDEGGQPRHPRRRRRRQGPRRRDDGRPLDRPDVVLERQGLHDFGRPHHPRARDRGHHQRARHRCDRPPG
jgi:hypothetical protein